MRNGRGRRFRQRLGGESGDYAHFYDVYYDMGEANGPTRSDTRRDTRKASRRARVLGLLSEHRGTIISRFAAAMAVIVALIISVSVVAAGTDRTNNAGNNKPAPPTYSYPAPSGTSTTGAPPVAVGVKAPGARGTQANPGNPTGTTPPQTATTSPTGTTTNPGHATPPPVTSTSTHTSSPPPTSSPPTTPPSSPSPSCVVPNPLNPGTCIVSSIPKLP